MTKIIPRSLLDLGMTTSCRVRNNLLPRKGLMKARYISLLIFCFGLSTSYRSFAAEFILGEAFSLQLIQEGGQALADAIAFVPTITLQNTIDPAPSIGEGQRPKIGRKPKDPNLPPEQKRKKRLVENRAAAQVVRNRNKQLAETHKTTIIQQRVCIRLLLNRIKELEANQNITRAE